MLELLIPFGLLVCSINTDFNRKQLSGFLIWYIVLALVMGLSSIFYYGEGFTIKELYSVPSKNQIGPILGISTVIIGIWILNKNQLEFKFNSLFFKLSLFFLLLSTILVIRNRASLIAIIITLLFYLIREYKFKLTVGRVLLGPFLVIATILLFYYGTFNGLLDVFWKSITLNYDVNNLNSLSAGRTEVYALSIQFIMQNPFLGELTSIQPFQYTTPHNYILNKWVQYGIVGSLPYIIFYCFLWVYSIRGILIVKSLFSLAHWVLFFSLIVSIFEYTYPYGPGVSQLLVWFLLGQYLKETLKK
ncbi:O-antigen ligase family protein [Sutcliffiella horikoshii]|uniref:O-antigen ligase family protein n=1 Tax=Sutcliffiella horikoshii TaxID=79883 RepID=UPI00203C0FBE|nr:O-antigen ligase family protein [Sutcliffiella horikoshii]MCM3617921.1 O-antigen ligase family protein [Sutcliffiella horikoshii]